MRQLPDQKEDDQEWTVKLLRDTSHRYITNRENAERHCATKDDNKHTVRSLWPTAQDVGEGKATTDTLVSVTKSPEDQKFRKRAIGIYCKRKRCSDECTNFLTVKARKEKGGIVRPTGRVFIVNGKVVITKVLALTNVHKTRKRL